ncbi:MAG: Kynurenine formamidase [Planctomycetota bacterium]|jgi:arylformamidase
MNQRALIDITPAITPDIAVWPGDTPVSREVLCELEKGATITLSTLRATVHLGAHADGANHYGARAASIDAMPLARYIGPCHVIDATVDRTAGGTRVRASDLRLDLAAIRHPRVLLRTGTFPDFTRWNSDFAGLEPSLIDALADRGVALIGVDTPSVDVQESKDLPAHARFLARDVSILEGLRLDHVAPGEYELIALPLPLVGFDASPVRAVLRSLA